ncbi:hypothetical protein [Prosthecodimorpha staleyi]|uniref:Uncharacterized protein n=1 Tax=Prosthecodimorpha staleyi TaxID=2840188 RepID=A0A947GE35_9HYPH|nr:hypothetical protein [Prosthecodimorpha staleyi]MBT9290946.1 hypothetical protein [Prosthecodimorpha staleyi]
MLVFEQERSRPDQDLGRDGMPDLGAGGADEVAGDALPPASGAEHHAENNPNGTGDNNFDGGQKPASG